MPHGATPDDADPQQSPAASPAATAAATSFGGSDGGGDRDRTHGDRAHGRRAEGDGTGDANTNGDGDASGDRDANANANANADANADPTGPEPAAEHDRSAMPVGDEEPPRLPFPVVALGASAGGLEAFTEFFAAMRPDSGMAFVVIQHLPPERESLLADLLGKRTRMPVRPIEDGMPVEPDHVYVIRPGHVLTIKNGVLRLGPPLDGRRAADHPIDDFFKSLAAEQRERAIAVVLSGAGSNGSVGAQAVKVVGGLCVAQTPESAVFPSMPRHLIDHGYADFVLVPREMPDLLLRYTGHPYARGGRADAAEVVQRDHQAFADVLAILRTRVKQDFGGYKRPTIFRRIQRRMGLNQVFDLPQYARTLRQNPAEVQALADDLLIHVTGFFRDPAAWEALRARVVEPLVADRENDATVRCWVTACSSGEEAYSLAILLAEAADAADKVLDVKIFATDMAERSLAHARAGTYPAAIETEVSPERLERFFDKEDSVYRVKRELRDMVVFAPQNVLQDPPFSKLDIATCRNLLIYLEPDVQRRIMNLLHFGLREGGTLFLGTSETIGGAGELFQPLDKRWRIYRRVGSTRSGRLAFPGVRVPADRPADDRPGGRPRLSVPQLTDRVLLERYTPPAVTVDRDHRVLYYHGDTHPFLAQPRGEPTHNLLALARDQVRGAVRVALANAVQANAPATARDGTIQTGDGPRRVFVTAAPLDPANAPGTYLVSFELQPEPDPAAAAAAAAGDPGTLRDELTRARYELQSTIEELQTSNEELKASNEEVTSVNEELQSTNEELETSKEELQSLNEELTTVNAQLQAKMEEHEAANNDLSSLLSSTDVGVVFLDPRLRIRRYTPNTRDLIDLIPADLGRPLGDLRRKFDDPALLDDCRTVLDKLVPAEREVTSEGGRAYARRVLPYRTADNRIDGIVITFVDVTDRRRARDELEAAHHYAHSIVETLHEPLLVLHPDLTVRGANAAFFRTFKVIEADTVGRKIYDLGNGQWRIPALRKLLEEVLPADRAFDDYEVSHAFDTIGPKVMLVNGRRLDHVPLILLGIRDVTEQKRAEDAVRVSEERLRRMTNVDGVGVLTFDEATGVLLTANDAFLNMTGYAAADVAAGRLSWQAMTPPEHMDVSRRQIAKQAETGRIGPYEKEYLRRDGTRLWMLFAGASLGGGTVVEYCVDISGRKRTEADLRESEERLRLILDGARDFGMLMHDPDGRITMWNAGAERLFRWTAAEAVGQPGAIIFTPEDRAAGAPEQERAEAAAKGRAADERWHVRKDGVRLWCSGSQSVLRGRDGAIRGFVKVLRDETARKRADEGRAELLAREQTARQQAELATRLKDEFLATLSHELRTPLSAILIWSRMLQGDAINAEQRKEGLDAIRSSAEAQRELIDDLLDTSRITAGKLRLDARDTELVPVMRAAVDAVLPTARAKNVRVETNFGGDVGIVQADPDRLRQVVWNLLSNAVKFTPAGGRVDVDLRRDGDEVEVRVADTGRGISADFLPHVFDMFRQADASTTRTIGGLGLGLAIAKQLVELHGGTIRAESGGPGKGAAFVVRLPLPRLESAAGPARSAGVPGAARATGSAEGLSGARILLVEDDPETRRALDTLLSQAGATVVAAGSAEAAVAAYAADRPDLIVSDIGLPGTDGYAMLRQIRATEAAEQATPVPAVALTAMARREDRKKALAAGFRQHIVKPVDPDHFVVALAALLGR